MPSDTRSIECPHCNKAVRYVAALAGQAVGCPTCGKGFRMPPVDDPGFAAPEPPREPAPEIITRSLSRPDKLPEILQELHRQTKMLANIRSHVRIIAWCVFLAFCLWLVAGVIGCFETVARLP